MYQRANGTWCDTLPQGKGKPPKFFYGKTKADVKRKMSEWTAEQERGILFKDAIEEWYEQKCKSLSYNSIRTYKPPVERLTEKFGDTPVKDIDSYTIQTYIEHLEKTMSKSTVSHHLVIMSMVFTHVILQPDSPIKYNPCDNVRCSGKFGRRGLPDANDIKIVKESYNLPFGLFAYLLVYTGLRRGEALALTNTDFSDTEISVSKAVVWENGKPVISDTKTQAGNRNIPLLEPLKKVLPKWKGFLFSNDGGKTPLGQYEFFKLWDNYCLSAGLCVEDGFRVVNGYKYPHYKNTIVPHQLRHEFATICLDAGLEPMDTAEYMGHSSYRTTEAIYQHIKESRRESTRGKLEEYIKAY